MLSLKDALLHDAAAPVVGNPDADVTIVAFFDYNCPYCRKSEANLAALLADDPKVRVIYKDFPILAKSSVKAAKVAIASAWQGKYADMHKALMSMNARPATDADIAQAAVASGVNVTKLNKDLDRRDGEIVALLKRNIQEADALHLQGTPVYLIGPFITATPARPAAVQEDRRRRARGSGEARRGQPVGSHLIWMCWSGSSTRWRLSC